MGDDYDDQQLPFLCGAIEGFYGKPWSDEQRKDLFKLMALWGMNAYMYAPKDDFKHRHLWREMYSDLELGEWCFPCVTKCCVCKSLLVLWGFVCVCVCVLFVEVC